MDKVYALITGDSFKPLIALPLILMILSLVLASILGLSESIDLKGGTLITLETKSPMSQSEITNVCKEATGVNDIQTSLTGNQATVTLDGSVDAETFTQKTSDRFSILSFKSVGALLTDDAMTQIIYSLIFAFVFMSVTVLFVFRDIVPSLAVILSAICNLSVALGGMSLFGIPLSLASVGALLMLIGYGVDTDILLTTRLLRRNKGSKAERIKEAFNTGITLSIAAILSMVVLYIVVKILIPSAQVLEDISAVMIIGLCSDILATWLMNLGILKWHIRESK